MFPMAPQTGDGAAVMDMPPDILQMMMMQGMPGSGGGLANMIQPPVQPGSGNPMESFTGHGSPSFSGLYPTGMGTAASATGPAGGGGSGGNLAGQIGGAVGSIGGGIAGSALGGAALGSVAGPIGSVVGGLIGSLL